VNTFLQMQEDIDIWPQINKLLAPLGTHTVKYDRNISTEEFINNGLVEVTIGVALIRTYQVSTNVHFQRKQYGLKHHMTGTIHYAMRDTPAKSCC